MEYRNPKEDCFAYDKNEKKCKALTSTFCKKEDCNFYRTTYDNEIAKIEAERKAHKVYKKI